MECDWWRSAVTETSITKSAEASSFLFLLSEHAAVFVFNELTNHRATAPPNLCEGMMNVL